MKAIMRQSAGDTALDYLWRCELLQGLTTATTSFSWGGGTNGIVGLEDGASLGFQFTVEELIEVPETGKGLQDLVFVKLVELRGSWHQLPSPSPLSFVSSLFALLTYLDEGLDISP